MHQALRPFEPDFRKLCGKNGEIPDPRGQHLFRQRHFHIGVSATDTEYLAIAFCAPESLAESV